MSKQEDLTAWITGLVERFLTRSPLNNLQNEEGAPAWEEAMVGFASIVYCICNAFCQEGKNLRCAFVERSPISSTKPS